MKGTLKSIMSLAVCGALAFTGCASEKNVPLGPIENWTAPDYKTEYYDNYQYNAYYNPEGAAEHLPDQGVYGSGNAFILRYNGMYYMYMGSQSSPLPLCPAGSRKI